MSSSTLLDRRGVIALLGAFGVGADALAQDAVRANPRAFAVLLDNEHVRVLEFTSRPGFGVCGPGVHSHPRHVNIAITPIKGRITLPDGKSFVAENKAGDVFWEDAVTHSVENIGGSSARAYMVELKEPLPKHAA
jgi:beta-alanine degradation protein BauB